MDEDIPQPCAMKTRKAAERQKGKNANRRAKPASTTPRAPGNNSGDVMEEENEIMARLAKAKEELKALEAQKEALAKEVTEASAAASVPKIVRPRGVSIQEGMGLSDNKPRYDAIRVCPQTSLAIGMKLTKVKRLVKDLCGQVGMNWEISWLENLAAKKAELYQAARNEAPYLNRFANDWATQALAMQLLKNRRGHSYRRGYLEVPEKYAYLKDNAAKRIHRRQGGDRDTSPLSDNEGTNDDSEPANMTGAVASGSKCKAPVATQQSRKKSKPATAKAAAASSTAKGKGKKKASTAGVGSEDETQDDEAVEEEE